MAYRKLMIKFSKEQFELMQAGKIILNRHALVPRGITALDDEKFIMDCIMHQSNELVKALKEATDKERVNNDAAADTAQTPEGDNSGAPDSPDTVSVKTGTDVQAVSKGTAGESE